MCLREGKNNVVAAKGVSVLSRTYIQGKRNALNGDHPEKYVQHPYPQNLSQSLFDKKKDLSRCI